MWTESGVPDKKYFQIEMCRKMIETIGANADYFHRVMNQPIAPIFDCSKERFAAMCVLYSKGNHG